jgi:hypothetical protein
VCDDVDDDCDGSADEGVSGCCEPGERGACGSDVGACVAGERSCGADREWGACDGVGPAEETCNDVDDDCDGAADETFDFWVDSRNCGRCGHACEGGAECRGGLCAVPGGDGGLDAALVGGAYLLLLVE